ncbi:MAG: hypothetical protein JST45_12930 [Bacteroidetes bacterium]|nr:hypothetical protein [Bacteroidota bacterium]
MRKDDEIHGATGTSYDFGARLYDSRIMRWLSLDPLAVDYPDQSPYSFAGNNPIYLVDPNGKEIVPSSAFSSNLRASSVFNQLKGTSTFQSGLNQFDGPKPIVHLYLDVQAWERTRFAETAPRSLSPYPFSISITFKQQYLASATDISIAATFLHEMVHAKVFRKFEASGGSVDAKNFPGLQDYGTRHATASTGWQHEMMAVHYRGEIVQGLREMDANNGITDRSGTMSVGGVDVAYSTDQFYEALSWQGLYGTKAYEKLDASTKDLYRGIMRKEAGGGADEVAPYVLPSIEVKPE